MNFDTLEGTAAARLHEIKTAARHLELADVIRARWSPHSFDAARPVSAKELKLIFEAARWTASCSNQQPWRFVVGQRGEELYDRIFSTLIDFNRLWAGNAPVLVAAAAKESFDDGRPNRWAAYDLGAAVNQLVLQAQALGLGARQMGGFDSEKASQVLGAPEGYVFYSVTAIGAAGDIAQLPDRMQKKEVLPGERRPLDQSVFGAWGEAASFTKE